MDERTGSNRTVTRPRLRKHEASYKKDLAEIWSGLKQQQKTISPKFFYDQAGSHLFDEICELPEYYLTRTELQIMRTDIADMAKRAGPGVCVIEFGSGTSLKTRLLLQHLDHPAAYLPVDISKAHLKAAATSLAADFPMLEVLPVVADFTQPFPLPNPRIPPLRNLVFFPGSTIGNFEPDDALKLLQVMYQEAGEHGALLIGVDLVKDQTILERAYNDSAGITAQFNLNLLQRLNNEFDSDFDLDLFEHLAIYDTQANRIEMRLISRTHQVVSVSGQMFRFAEGEYIVTEHSHKYTIEGFSQLAAQAGFQVDKVWTDPDRMFSVQYATRT